MHFHRFYIMCGIVLMTLFKRKKDQYYCTFYTAIYVYVKIEVVIDII